LHKYDAIPTDPFLEGGLMRRQSRLTMPGARGLPRSRRHLPRQVEQGQCRDRAASVQRKENVIILDLPSVGKTHLAISLAVAAARNGGRVCFGALADLS
jgi:Mrp family chromosome partitioning ATPase